MASCLMEHMWPIHKLYKGHLFKLPQLGTASSDHIATVSLDKPQTDLEFCWYMAAGVNMYCRVFECLDVSACIFWQNMPID